MWKSHLSFPTSPSYVPFNYVFFIPVLHLHVQKKNNDGWLIGVVGRNKKSRQQNHQHARQMHLFIKSEERASSKQRQFSSGILSVNSTSFLSERLTMK